MSITGSCPPIKGDNHHAFSLDKGAWDAINRMESIFEEKRNQRFNPPPEKNLIDKEVNLVQNNPTMKKSIRFVTAVLLAQGDLRLKGEFSIYDITNFLREKVNTNALVITDKQQEVIDGITTYKIDHQEVKEVFNELLVEVLSNLDSRNNGAYKIFFQKKPSCDVVLPGNQQVSGQGSLAIPAVAPANSNSSADCSCKQPIASTNATKVSAYDYVFQVIPEFDGQLADYFATRYEGRAQTDISLKEIQSRFKNLKVKCSDYADILEKIGFNLDKNGNHPSKWFISFKQPLSS